MHDVMFELSVLQSAVHVKFHAGIELQPLYTTACMCIADLNITCNTKCSYLAMSPCHLYGYTDTI